MNFLQHLSPRFAKLLTQEPPPTKNKSDPAKTGLAVRVVNKPKMPKLMQLCSKVEGLCSIFFSLCWMDMEKREIRSDFADTSLVAYTGGAMLKLVPLRL